MAIKECLCAMCPMRQMIASALAASFDSVLVITTDSDIRCIVHLTKLLTFRKCDFKASAELFFRICSENYNSRTKSKKIGGSRNIAFFVDICGNRVVCTTLTTVAQAHIIRLARLMRWQRRGCPSTIPFSGQLR